MKKLEKYFDKNDLIDFMRILLPISLVNFHKRNFSKIYLTSSFLLIILFGVLVYAPVFSQDGGSQKIDNAKIGLITNRLNLSAEQSQQFWPIYNEFDGKKKDIRKQMRRLIVETNTLTTSDDKILANLKETLNLQQKEVDLEREYMAKFLKVINVRQLAELYKAEQVFTQMLLKRLNNARKE